ncbi:fibrinogen-like protein 1 [Apostichopus japonicus]|uniref:fibrinogen-like protein 1 n=1 Tax=Stichopus japonicus TaxID=307972 RepID=UPI003AB7F9D3
MKIITLEQRVHFQILFWITGSFLLQLTSAQPENNHETTKQTTDSSIFFYQQPGFPRDCKEVRDQCDLSNSSGIYLIKPETCVEPFEVYCDSSHDAGGWTVIHRRFENGSVEFNRNWESYKNGFGFLSHEFYLGNEKISLLTNQNKYELIFEITTSNGSTFQQSYENFRIGDEFSNYKLVSLERNSGTLFQFSHFVDCQDAYTSGFKDNGIYKIKPNNWPGSAFNVYCNMTDGGGWIVVQRRVDGSVDFYLDWDNYKQGFGNLNSEFWIGNEKLHFLTNAKRQEIRIDLVNRNGAPYFAKFDNFGINNETDNYRLSVIGTYSGTADSRSNPDGYALRYHLARPFSTYDRDNDPWSGNCAINRHGAWWYNECAASNFNGEYFGPRDSYRSIEWETLPGSIYNIQFTEMKIRPFAG